MTTYFAHVVARGVPKESRMISEGKVGARLVTFHDGTEAVMKIASHKVTKKQNKMQRGISVEEMPKNEVVFYQLAKVFGFEDLVPETVLGTFHGYPASFQHYVDGTKLYKLEPRLRDTKDRNAWIIAFRETLRDVIDIEDTRRLTLLDFLAASRDRHAANYGARLEISSEKAKWRLVGWDNGCAFGLTQEKYHCVAHKHVFRYAFDLSSVWDRLQSIRRNDLKPLTEAGLTELQTDHVWFRLQFVLSFPHRMSWNVLSNEIDDIDAFPNLENIFVPMVSSRSLYVLQNSPK